jgi:glycosyltransferase involved in cell wall biosynthesis
MSQKIILHLTADFPDSMVRAKTRSVISLIENTPGYRHVVYSLNRVSGRSDIASLDFGPDRVAVAYGAPSRGLFLRTRLIRLADWITRDLASRGIEDHLINAHKFTVEGLIALRLLEGRHRPLVCEIWGDTDLRITGARPDLNPQWRQIARTAAAVTAYAPWTLERFGPIVGLDRGRGVVLPPIIRNDTFVPAPVVGRPRFVSVMNLDSYKRKNLPRLAEAIVKLSSKHPDISLDVWGTGAPRTIAEVREILAGAGAADRVILRGPLDQADLSRALQTYAGFLMPSLRETFGMVFIEALFCGLPILYSRGWGVDGYFEDSGLGYRCDAGNLDDICAGIDVLAGEEAALKSRIAQQHAARGFDRFKTANIVETYRGILEGALAPAT